MNGARFGGTVAVVGGGVVGRACAIRLAKAGFDVTLVDPHTARAPASYGNAGHIATEQVEPLASPAALRSAYGRLFGRGGALDLRWRDVHVWGPWTARYLRASGAAAAERGRAGLSVLLKEALPAWRRLAQDIGRPDLVVENGHLVAWVDPARAEAGRRAWMSADTGTARIGDVDPAAWAQLLRTVRAPLAGGVAFTHTGQVSDPVEVMGALGRRFEALGGRRLRAAVQRVAPIRRGVALQVHGDWLTFDQAVIASGVGSRALLSPLGHVAPVIAERGYHVEGPDEGWGGLPPVVVEDRSLIVARFGSRLRATSFVEFGHEHAPPDPRKGARLERHIAELGIPMGAPRKTWVGARPTLPDYLPAIGRSRRAPSVLYAFGHQHLGLTLAPVTGELVASLALGRTPAAPLQPFDIDRFAPPSTRTTRTSRSTLEGASA